MNVNNISYNQNSNRAKQPSFQMQFESETLKLIEHTGLGKWQREMLDSLMLDKDSDALTAKIIKVGDEFVFGLQHKDYKMAREVYPSNGAVLDMDYYHKYSSLNEYPRVPLGRHTLPGIIEKVFFKIKSGERFQGFIDGVLIPRHTENLKNALDTQI